MQTGDRTPIPDPVSEQQTTENRWCEKHGYLIDVDACRARALQRRYCGLCLARWRQLPLPFPEPF
jgi:hypothetical protein